MNQEHQLQQNVYVITFRSVLSNTEPAVHSVKVDEQSKRQGQRRNASMFS
jgi:hypothetical protein